MTSFINKFRRKRENNNSTPRNSLTIDHIFIPERDRESQNPDISNGSSDLPEGIEIRQKSQLAYSLDRLLADSSALSYFIQFLESSEKLNLIKFWMHVQGFQATFNEGVTAAQELSLRDARNIYDKYIDEGSNSTLAVPRKIKLLIDEQMQKVPLQKTCFDDAQQFVRQLFEFRYFEEFQSSVYYKKHELEVLSNGCSIIEILKIQPLLLSFLEFIKEKEDHDMLQFLLGCDSFEVNFEEMEDEEALCDAMALYDKYFSMQATNPINAGAPIRSEMESLICDESGRPNQNCFKNATAFCYFQLQDKYIADFIRSSSFQTYLLDLSIFIENTVELPRKNRHRISSRGSCSSSADSSISFGFSKNLDNLEQKDVDRTPTGSQKGTPKTPRSSRLAEIDEIGRYHALYDDSHTQNHKTPTRIQSTLRKYLDKNTLREEEIAEEVARTIIKDMQNMVASAKSQNS